MDLKSKSILAVAGGSAAAFLSIGFCVTNLALVMLFTVVAAFGEGGAWNLVFCLPQDLGEIPVLFFTFPARLAAAVLTEFMGGLAELVGAFCCR